MKNLILSSVVVAGLLLSGCGSKTPAQERANAMIEKYNDLPKWVIENNDIDSAVGSAPSMGQTYMQQQMEAISVAKMNLSQQLYSKVTSMVKNYYEREGGVSKDYNAQVSIQVAKMLVESASIVDTYVSEDGELFVKVKAKSTNLLEAIKADNKEALFNELKEI